MFSINPSAIQNAPPMILWALMALWLLAMVMSNGYRLEMLVGLVLITLPIYIVVFFAKQVAVVINGIVVSLAIVIGQAGTE